MQRAEQSQKDLADILLDWVGYPENGESEQLRQEWLAKKGIPLGMVIGALGLLGILQLVR